MTTPPDSVLVVDDDLAVGKVLIGLLQQAGFACRHATSAEGALEVLKKTGVDVVLSFAGTVKVTELSDASVKGSFDLKTDQWLHAGERFTGVFDALRCEGLKPDAPTWSNHQFKEY